MIFVSRANHEDQLTGQCAPSDECQLKRATGSGDADLDADQILNYFSYVKYYLIGFGVSTNIDVAGYYISKVN